MGNRNRMNRRVVSEVAPEPNPRTWYGFPSYAADGNVVVFYQPASTFKPRYGHIGFQEGAKLDDGPMWATSFAVVEVNVAVGRRVRALVKKVVRDWRAPGGAADPPVRSRRDG